MGKFLNAKRHLQVKYVMYAVNMVIMLVGLVLMALGIWLRSDFDIEVYTTNLDPILALCEYIGQFSMRIRIHLDSIAYFLIFLGVGITGMGLIGCCGAVQERQTMMCMFVLCSFSIFGIMLAAVISSGTNIGGYVRCEHQIEDKLGFAVRNYHNMSVSKSMDTIQQQLQCCGASQGVHDYGSAGPPESCRKHQANTTDFYQQACNTAVKDFFNSLSGNLITIMVISVAFGVFLVLGMGLSGYLFCMIKTETHAL